MMYSVLYVAAVTIQAMLGGNVIMYLAITFAFLGYFVFFRSAFELSEFAIVATVFLTLLNISQFSAAGDVKFGYARILIQAIVVAAVMYRRRLAVSTVFRGNPPIMLFGLWALASAPLGLAPLRSATYAVWFLLSVGMIIVHGLIAPNMRVAVRSLARALVLGYGLALVPSIFEMAMNPGVLTTRFYSPIGMHHVPAQGAGLAIAALLYLCEERGWRRVYTPAVWGFVALASIAAIASLNRTAWFSLAVALGGYFFIRPRNWLRDSAVFATGIALFLLFISSASQIARQIPKAAQTRWEMTTESGGALVQGDLEHTDERIFVWRDKMRFLAQHPIAGAGLVNSIRATTGQVPDPDMRYMSAHSTFVGVLVETGWVGTIIFAWFLLGVIAKSVRLFRVGQEFRYLVIIALSALTLSFFEFNGTPGQATFWPFFGSFVLLGLRRNWLAVDTRIARRYPSPVPTPHVALRGM